VISGSIIDENLKGSGRGLIWGTSSASSFSTEKNCYMPQYSLPASRLTLNPGVPEYVMCIRTVRKLCERQHEEIIKN